jgi:choline dehydrogenase-like flavoprotein
MIVTDLPGGMQSDSPVIVVGAGPAGIVQALELRRHGVAVTVLAGGLDGFRADFQALADAEIVDPRRHAPMQMAVRRAFGGTSLLWGGRCVAFDDIDFAERDHVPYGGWPLTHDAIRPWYATAARYLDCGPPQFEEVLELLAGGGNAECRLDRLERWSEARDLRRLHAETLENDPGLRVCLGAVATGIDLDPASGRATGLHVALADGRRAVLRAGAIVLACGGLETTRLLLAAQGEYPQAFGGENGPLGRYYMGHLEGSIADIVFAAPGYDRALDFHVDASRHYVRRRITVTGAAQRRHGLLNLAAWPDNPALGMPEHRSAILSLAYLSLAAPGLGPLLAPDAIRRKHLPGRVQALRPHLCNIVRGVPEAVREAARFLYGRYVARPRLPGFFIANRAHRYALFYHAEQAPNPESRVTLADERDRLGMPRLRIDLRYGEIDARSVAESHKIIDRHLREAEIGRLDYRVAEAERVASALAQATDGYHQIGTTRMAADPARGVVDPNCRVHGSPNLFVAGSSVFPTSGQANPTLLLAAFSARLADHLSRTLPGLPAGIATLPPAPAAARRRSKA